MVLGGEYLDDSHMAPTLIQGEGILDSRVYREETFGPLIGIMSVKVHDESRIMLMNAWGREGTDQDEGLAPISFEDMIKCAMGLSTTNS